MSPSDAVRWGGWPVGPTPAAAASGQAQEEPVVDDDGVEVSLPGALLRLVRAHHGAGDHVPAVVEEEEAPPETRHVQDERQEGRQARHGRQGQDHAVLLQASQRGR